MGDDQNKEISILLPRHPGAARSARNVVRATLSGVVPEEVVYDVCFLTNELVSNSILHSCSNSIELKLLMDDDSVHVEVIDEGEQSEPRARLAAPLDASGRGLHLVQKLSDRWGSRGSNNTCVWFEIDRPC